MPKFNATPLIVAGVVGVAAVGAWWLWGRSRAQASEPPTLEILTPPIGTSSPSGTRIDFSARAMSSGSDISSLTHWRVIEPAFMAGEWDIGASTFVVPAFLQTRVLTMEAYVFAPDGNSASAQRSVTVVVPASQSLPVLGPARSAPVSRVVPSFRRSDTGWQVRDRHVLEEPFIFARRN